jgi:hypothetical protein
LSGARIGLAIVVRTLPLLEERTAFSGLGKSALADRTAYFLNTPVDRRGLLKCF